MAVDGIEFMTSMFDIACAVVSLGAAVCWSMSAKVKIPSKPVFNPTKEITEDNSEAYELIQLNYEIELSKQIEKQTYYNRSAAYNAAIAAFIQFILIFIRYWRHLIN